MNVGDLVQFKVNGNTISGYIVSEYPVYDGSFHVDIDVPKDHKSIEGDTLTLVERHVLHLNRVHQQIPYECALMPVAQKKKVIKEAMTELFESKSVK